MYNYKIKTSFVCPKMPNPNIFIFVENWIQDFSAYPRTGSNHSYYKRFQRIYKCTIIRISMAENQSKRYWKRLYLI